ncbi:MAG TPA: hypothetical protein VHT25_03595 [Solirubrobacteraceae bacterium]|jgi:hypothetical protein|nr:hypothetical protein [Solirubrobacteraceae bacterium]
MEPRYRTLMIGLQPQPRQMPPPPLDHDVLSAIFAELIQTDAYQGFTFTPDGRGAQFNNGHDDTVELRPMVFSIQARMNGPDVLTVETAETKIARIVSLAADKLDVPAFLQCGIQIVAEVDAPGDDARAFVAETLMRGSEQAGVLGDGFFGGAVRFRNLREPGNPDEDDLSIEPDIHNDRLIYIDYKSARAAITGPIDLDQVSILMGEAFAFLDGPTMQLLSSGGE